MDAKKLLPHLIAVAVLLLTAAIFYAPNAFSGKVLPQPDNDKARAMQTEIRDYLSKEGKVPLWTNSAFGGMPSYQILSPMKGNLTRPVYRTLFLFKDYTNVWAQTFTAMLCMYLLLMVLKLDWRVGVFGALAFGITSYNVDLLEELLLKCNLFGIPEGREATAADCFDDNCGVHPHKNRSRGAHQFGGPAANLWAGFELERAACAHGLSQQTGSVELHDVTSGMEPRS